MLTISDDEIFNLILKRYIFWEQVPRSNQVNGNFLSAKEIIYLDTVGFISGIQCNLQEEINFPINLCVLYNQTTFV